MIELSEVKKTYRMGNVSVEALKGVSLKIVKGEFVSIMGPSGSGKSTLMHILGLLDVPDSGSYRLGQREVSRLTPNGLAALRRDAFGFIFQQFNLLPRLTALENVRLPLLYTPQRSQAARNRAQELLDQVGLSDRADHRPNELSGGQQQRVAISRALINAPAIVLADEPTGNLDSKSEREILDILAALNRQGITVIIVTHEEEIGRRTNRIIRMRDGMVQSDEHMDPVQRHAGQAQTFEAPAERLALSDLLEYMRQGFKSLAGNKIRTFLSTLGILIGVAAVVAMLALGKGAQESIEKQLASLGSNLLVLRPGALRVGGVALETGAVTRLSEEDAETIERLVPAVKKAAPTVNGRGQISHGNRNWNTQIVGATTAYESIRAASPAGGRFFTEEEDRKRALVALIGMTVMRQLFDAGQSPIGEMIKINRIPFQVIGVLPERGATGFRDQDDMVVVPLDTAMRRLLGKDYVDTIDIEALSPADVASVQRETLALMLRRHKVPSAQLQDAYEIRNMADIQAAFTKTSRTMSLLLSSIAAISLLVGGIGIMNIMLVSVTERTREIGLRKAIGARNRDVLIQFLSEAVVVSVIGGLLGIAAGAGISAGISRLAGWATSISLSSIILAFTFSAGIGVIFGIYPARSASALNPIEALRSE